MNLCYIYCYIYWLLLSSVIYIEQLLCIVMVTKSKSILVLITFLVIFYDLATAEVKSFLKAQLEGQSISVQLSGLVYKNIDTVLLSVQTMQKGKPDQFLCKKKKKVLRGPNIFKRREKVFKKKHFTIRGLRKIIKFTFCTRQGIKLSHCHRQRDRGAGCRGWRFPARWPLRMPLTNYTNALSPHRGSGRSFHIKAGCFVFQTKPFL